MTPRPRQDEEALLAHSSAVHALGAAPETLPPGNTPRPASGTRGGPVGCGRWGQRLTLSSQRNPHWGRSTQTLEELPSEKPLEGALPCRLRMCSAVSPRFQFNTALHVWATWTAKSWHAVCLPTQCSPSQRLAPAGSNSPVNGASLRRARSAEAESPPTTQLYALRSRAAPPHRSPPGFGASPDPEAAAAADHAASTTMGPIKSRLKVCHLFPCTPCLSARNHA